MRVGKLLSHLFSVAQLQVELLDPVLEPDFLFDLGHLFVSNILIDHSDCLMKLDYLIMDSIAVGEAVAA